MVDLDQLACPGGFHAIAPAFGVAFLEVAAPFGAQAALVEGTGTDATQAHSLGQDTTHRTSTTWVSSIAVRAVRVACLYCRTKPRTCTRVVSSAFRLLSRITTYRLAVACLRYLTDILTTGPRLERSKFILPKVTLRADGPGFQGAQILLSRGSLVLSHGDPAILLSRSVSRIQFNDGASSKHDDKNYSQSACHLGAVGLVGQSDRYGGLL